MVNKLDPKYECPIDLLLLRFIGDQVDIYNSSHISPNMITTFSIICGIFSAANIYWSNFHLAAVLFAVAYYFDCVDGKMARKFNKVTVFGDYYDHFGDIFKTVIVIYALHASNPELFGKVAVFIAALFFLSLIHLGCQEKIYDPKNVDFLSVFKILVPSSIEPKKCIQYTKYFGVGTFMLFMILIIFFWSSKPKTNSKDNIANIESSSNL